MRVQRYYFYLKIAHFIDDFFKKICRITDDFSIKLLIYSHFGSIHVLGSLLLVLAYLTDDGDETM